MSTILSSPFPHEPKQPVALPWETLLHIFSYCDQPTLAAISLVSFDCWELAGPILYQDVEIVDLDGLASLFFLDIVPSSPRLKEATSLLSKIETLSVRIRAFRQRRAPFFDWPMEDEDGEDSFDDIRLLPPSRLLAFTTQPLPLQSLHFPVKHASILPLFNWMCLQLLPHLNPTEVVHRHLHPTIFAQWPSRAGPPLAVGFLSRWTDLRRILWEGYTIVVTPQASGQEEDDDEEEGERYPLYSRWSPPVNEERRSLEIVFVTYGYALRTRRTLLELLQRGGVDEELSQRVSLKVVLKASQMDEEMFEKDVRRLPEWLRKSVRVEVKEEEEED